jgi:uncharacterized membrane protein
LRPSRKTHAAGGLALTAAILYCGAQPSATHPPSTGHVWSVIMGLAILILGLVVFLGTHIFVTFRDTRAALITRLGHGYRAIFALVSIAGLALIVWGYADYRGDGSIPVWSPPAFMRHITIGLMLLASIFMAAAFVPSHAKSKLKHPMLASIKTWALAHLLSNGDLGSILLFGSFLAWGVYARIAAKRRGDLGAVTAPAGWINDVIVLVVGILLFLVLGYLFHPYAIGVPVFGR